MAGMIDGRRVEEAVAAQLEGEAFSGVILVHDAQQQVFARAFGYANRADRLPNTVDTRFGQASGSKTFTAAAVCRLVETGTIGFDTPLATCLDVWPRHFGPDVTVHHLLTHTSGLPDYFDEEVEDDYSALWADVPMYEIRGPGDLLPLFGGKPAGEQPGRSFHYSNAGYVLLGLLVEQHTAMPFQDMVEEEVFGPAAMTDSAYFPLDRLPARTATGYLTDENHDEPRTNVYSIPVVGQPDGGAFVTAPDMVGFWRALAAGDVLSEETLEPMLTPQVATGGGHYGYGLWIEQRSAGRIHYAMGADPGARFVSGAHLESGRSVTVIGNTDRPAWPIYDSVASVAFHS
jgi:CubicO group peptidase (beta-lactamase class C family)